MNARSIAVAAVCLLALVAAGCVVAPYRDGGRYFDDRHDHHVPYGRDDWRGHRGYHHH